MSDNINRRVAIRHMMPCGCFVDDDFTKVLEDCDLHRKWLAEALEAKDDEITALQLGHAREWAVDQGMKHLLAYIAKLEAVTEAARKFIRRQNLGYSGDGERVFLNQALKALDCPSP